MLWSDQTKTKLWLEFVCLETGSTSSKDDLTSCKPGSGSLILQGCVAASGTGHILPIEGRMDSNSPFSVEELPTVFQNLKLLKSPGPDGLPNEYYKTFADILMPHCLTLFNAIVHHKAPPAEMLRAIITTILFFFFSFMLYPIVLHPFSSVP